MLIKHETFLKHRGSISVGAVFQIFLLLIIDNYGFVVSMSACSYPHIKSCILALGHHLYVIIEISLTHSLACIYFEIVTTHCIHFFKFTRETTML